MAADLNDPQAQAEYQAEQARLAEEARKKKEIEDRVHSEFTDMSDPTNWASGIYNGLDDMFSAEQVSGPAKGSWGQSGTAAAQLNAGRNLAGANARDEYQDKGAGVGASMGGASAGLRGQAATAGLREGPTTNYAGADQFASKGQSARNTSTNLLNEAAGSSTQDKQLAALNNFANQAPTGPSAAEAQLAASSDAAQRQALSMARSGRGAGDSASALSDAMMSNAATQQQTGAQASTLRAQEDQARKEMQLQALNAAMGGANAIRGSDLDAYNGSLGIRNQDLQAQQQAAQQSQFLTTTDLQQQQLNDALNLGLGKQAFDYTNLGVNADLSFNQLGEQTNFQQQQLGQQALDKQADYELAQQQMQLDAAKANQQADLDNDGGVIGAIGSVASIFSDERSKKEISRLEHVTHALSTALADNDNDALDTVRGADAYEYEYKDPSQPGAMPGRVVGPMAQDLEKGPLGHTVVRNTPQGKMVDPDRLTMINSSAIAEQQRQIDALNRALGKKAA